MIFIEINIVGANCSNGKRLKKIIQKVSLDNKVSVIINELNKTSDKKKYNINMIPAIVVNDKIISQGQILSDREIKKLILSTNNI